MTSILLRYLSSRDWNGFLKRIELYPNEIHQIYRDGESVLQRACALNPPTFVIQQILLCDKSNILKPRKKSGGITPLRAAIVNASDEVVLLLLRTNTKLATIKDNQGLYPIHYSFDFNRSIDVILAIFSAYPQALGQPLRKIEPEVSGNKSCLSLKPVYNNDYVNGAMFQRWDNFAKKCRNQKISGKTKDLFFKNASLFFNLLYYGKVEKESFEEKPFETILHSIYGADSNFDFVHIHKQMFSEYIATIKNADKNRNLPLHILVSRLDFMGSCESNLDDVSRLIKVYPQAASVKNHCGKYPLNIALQNGGGWDTVIEMLFASYPEALRIRNEKTSLFPFMEAAAFSDLDTTFRLLRYCPEVIQYVMNNEYK